MIFENLFDVFIPYQIKSYSIIQQFQKMISPSTNINFNKLPIYLKTELDAQVRSRNQVYQEKIVSLNQLEVFYLPFMKQVYNVNKQRLQGTIKSPQQLIKALKRVQPKQSQIKRRFQPYKRDNQYKDAKIKQLIAKVLQLSNQIKHIKPDEEINTKIKIDFNQQQKLKRMQDLMKIKNDQNVFRIKMKVINLLQEFEINKKQIEEINKKESQYDIFDFMITKLKSKLKLIMDLQKNSIQITNRQKLGHESYDYKIKYLEQTNQIMQNNQKIYKQKIQQIKKQWKIVCDRLIIKEKQCQQKQIQLYRLKNMIDQKQSHLIRLNVTQKNNSNQQENSKKQIQTQLQQLRNQVNNHLLELNQLRTSNYQKQSTIQECKIKQIFLQEECERMNRQYIRWKERYQITTHTQQIKYKNYQIQIQELKQKLDYYQQKDMNQSSQIYQKIALLQNYQQKIKVLKDQNQKLNKQILMNQSKYKQIQEKYLMQKQDLVKKIFQKQKQILDLKSIINDIQKKSNKNQQNFSKKFFELQSSINSEKEKFILRQQIQYQNKFNEINQNKDLEQKKLKQQYDIKILQLKQQYDAKLLEKSLDNQQQKIHNASMYDELQKYKKQVEKLNFQLNFIQIQSQNKSIKITALQEQINNNRNINHLQQIVRLQTQIKQLNQSSQNFNTHIIKLEEELRKKNTIQETNNHQIYKLKAILSTKLDQQAKLNQQIKKLKQGRKDNIQNPYPQNVYYTTNMIKVGDVTNRKVQIIRLKDLKKC